MQTLHEDRKYNLECAILSTFLYADDFGIDTEGIVPNPDYFLHPYTKHVAGLIKRAMEKGKSTATIAYLLDDKVAGTQWEISHLDIMAQTPLAGLKSFYNILKADAIAREAKLEIR